MNEKDLIKTALAPDLPDVDALKEACKNDASGRRRLKALLCAAACLVVVVAVAAAAHGGKLLHRAENPSTGKDGAQASLDFNDVEALSDNALYIEGHFWRELTQEEIAELLPSVTADAVCATANFKGDGTLFNLDAEITANGVSTQLLLAFGEVVLDYVLETDKRSSDVNGVTVTAACFKGNRGNTWFVSFVRDGIAYYLENSGGDEARAALCELTDALTAGEVCDLAGVETGEIPELIDERLTLSQAMADERFGAHVPSALPSRFTFEEAARFKNQDFDELYLRWVCGEEEIIVTVSALNADVEARLTSVEDKVNYDLSLYPIPRGESVPPELGSIVDNPVFPLDELTLEAVKARAYVSPESDAQRIEFSVLDGDTVISLMSKGVKPEEIYNLILKGE